jgi:hypothetical protein
MNDTTTTAPADRAALRDDLAALGPAFQQLVGEIGDANWRKRSGIPAWTCGQLAWHLAQAAEFQAGQIEAAARGKALNPPSFLLPVAFKLNELRVRVGSRKATPASVLPGFDAGIKRLLALLDATGDAALAATVTAFGETRTLAATFRQAADHFTEHAADIRAGFDRGQGRF